MSVQGSNAAPSPGRDTARRGLLIFFILVVVFEAAVVSVIATTGDTRWFLALMWSVAVASIICRLVLGEGFRDVSFRFGGLRTLAYVAAAVLLPVVVGFIAYGIAWATGLATFAPAAGAFPFAAASGGFLAGLLGAATVGVPLSAVSAAGEELGWRGYMLTRLIDAGVPRPVLVSGLIWGLWHVPLIVAGVYLTDPGHSALITVSLFMVSVIAFAFVLACFRLATGSIWPAIVLHAAWNSVIQAAFDPATTGPGAPFWVGEAGILTASTTVVVAAVVLSVGRRRMLRTPREPIAA